MLSGQEDLLIVLGAPIIKGIQVIGEKVMVVHLARAVKNVTDADVLVIGREIVLNLIILVLQEIVHDLDQDPDLAIIEGVSH